MDARISTSVPKHRRRRWTLALLVALLAGEAVALVTLVVVAISNLVYACWDLVSGGFDLPIRILSIAEGLSAIVLAALVGYAIYRTAKAACRRNFQFSLRAILLATAVVAFVLGTVGQQVFRYHRLHQVLDAGAFFQYVPGVKLDWRNDLEVGWMERQLGYDPFRQVTYVNAYADRALTNMATQVECFSDVDTLTLRGPSITDTGLAHADVLGRLPRLRVVTLREGTAVTDSGLESLSRWANVESLMINDSPGITNDGLAHLRRMKRLKHLAINADQTTSRLSDAGLAHLRCVTGLESVAIVNVKITDAGLKHLEEMKQLKEIWLVTTNVSEDGFKHLQQALPNCRVRQRWDWEGLDPMLSCTNKSSW